MLYIRVTCARGYPTLDCVELPRIHIIVARKLNSWLNSHSSPPYRRSPCCGCILARHCRFRVAHSIERSPQVFFLHRPVSRLNGATRRKLLPMLRIACSTRYASVGETSRASLLADRSPRNPQSIDRRTGFCVTAEADCDADLSTYSTHVHDPAHRTGL
jgi:hypothetical protein